MGGMGEHRDLWEPCIYEREKQITFGASQMASLHLCKSFPRTALEATGSRWILPLPALQQCPPACPGLTPCRAPGDEAPGIPIAHSLPTTLHHRRSHSWVTPEVLM